MSRAKDIGLRLIGLAVGLGISSLVMLATGYDLGGFFSAFVEGLGPNLDSTLRWYAPLLLAGLAGLIAFRDGAFNLGLDGQIYVGGAGAAVVAIAWGPVLPAPLVVAIACVVAVLAGAAVAGAAALLRVLFGTPEVITTLVMNPLCAIAVTLLVVGPLAPQGGGGNTESSAVISEQLWLPALSPQSLATVAVVFALLAALLVGVYYRFTVWGFEATLYGAAPEFSFASGVPNRRVFVRRCWPPAALPDSSARRRCWGSSTASPRASTPASASTASRSPWSAASRSSAPSWSRCCSRCCARPGRSARSPWASRRSSST